MPATPLLDWLAGRAAIEPDVRDGAAALAEPAAAQADEPEWLARALATDEPFAALSLMAAGLPPREGVWWAWVSVRHAMQGDGDAAWKPAEHAALSAVERWITQPTDENRRAAWAAGEAAGVTTPAGAACAAAFLSGGSIAAAASPMAVPPPPGAHTAMVAAAVLAGGVKANPDHLSDVVHAAVAQAGAVAQRLGGWEKSATKARRHYEQQREAHGAAVDAATPKAPPA